MKKIALVFGVVLLMVLAVTQNGFAAILWDWNLNQSNFVVGPNDVVELNARLYNDASSTGNITYDSLACAGQGGDSYLYNSYNFAFGPGGSGDFFSQFSGMNLAPGNSYDFIFGVLTPKAPPIADGTTVQGSTCLSRRDAGCIVRPFQITVDGKPAPAVPEPATILLLGAGLTGTFLRKRKA